MSDPRILRANERYKAVSSAFFQLGTALIAATIVKIYVAQSFDLESFAWLFIAIAIISVGWLMLGLLDLEARDDPDSR